MIIDLVYLQSYQQQQWQQPQVQHDQNNWYGKTETTEKEATANQPPSNTNTPNYWQQPYVQPNFNANQQLPTQYNQYGHYQNYYPHQGSVKNEPCQQGYYPNQQSQSYLPHDSLNQPSDQRKDGDSDPWNWGWEDNNLNQGNVIQNNQNVQDSFTNDESWNWTVDDSSANQNVQNKKLVENSYEGVSYDTQFKETREFTNVNQTSSDGGNNSNDTAEQLPKHASISRIKSEKLTPQWSIESQVSQDSSDDVLLTSESDNRSNILSRSSTISHSPSRPSSTHENLICDNVSGQKPPEHNLSNKKTTTNEILLPDIRQEAADNIDNVHKYMQDLSLNTQFENKEIVTPENFVSNMESKPVILDQSSSQLEANSYQILLSNTQNKEVTKQIPESNLPLPVANTYKRNNLMFSRESLPNPNSEASVQNSYLSSFRQDNLSVNLETLPENSERPDQLVTRTPKQTNTIPKQWVAENSEIAAINDRNQYLETGQLSDIDIPYSESGLETSNHPSGLIDTSDSLPPPGLRRLVLGQMEQTEAASNDNEPPPGLSRMVLGRTEPEANPTNQDSFSSNTAEFRNEEPPIGLHRMVPGESSSPESSYSRYQTDSHLYQQPHYDDDNYVSESELNQVGALTISHRSATIGADTPPAVNQQYSTSSSIEPATSRVGAVGIDNEQRDTDVDGANTLDESIASVSSLPPDNNRRDNIDGGPQDDERSQTSAQNASSSTVQQDKGRKASDHERQERFENDPRYYEDKRKERDSPDYRDRKYDRRYERRERYDDDTDYNSDKEKNERRKKENIDDYERRYTSLRRDKDRDRDRERDKRRREYGRDDRDRRNDYYYRYEDYNRDVNR